MTILGTEEDDKRILVSLALALIDNPRASLQELARAIGISKTTLYRFCRTREQLIERLMDYGAAVLGEAIRFAELDNGPPLEGLRRLIANNLEHREMTSFLMYFWKEAPENICDDSGWDASLDAFFLRGQQQGLFRIDIPAAALTEILVNIIVGLSDAERRGRVARAGLAGLIESAFLNGAMAAPRS